jgi:co-chaperonin GroES (HSP10)
MNPLEVTPVGNNVLVELQENDSVLYKSLKLIIPTHAVSHPNIAYYCGKVIKTPTELDGTSFEWHTEMELQKDDIVMFAYAAGAGIASMELYFTHDDKKYANIKYPLIYLRIRDGVLSGVNGYVITEAIAKKAEVKGNIIIPKSGNEARFSRVIGLSVPNKAYRHSPEVNESNIHLEMDDIVFMNTFGAAPLEIFSRVFEKEIYANQRKHIIGKLKNKNMDYTKENFALYGQRLLVKEIKGEKKSAGGIILPDSAVKRSEVEVVMVGNESPKGYKEGDKFLVMTGQLNIHNTLEFDGEFHHFIPINENTILGKIG